MRQPSPGDARLGGAPEMVNVVSEGFVMLASGEERNRFGKDVVIEVEVATGLDISMDGQYTYKIITVCMLKPVFCWS